VAIIAIVRYVSFRRLRARLRVLEQQAALQRERARIAKDIHDDLGANLTQIAYLGELANQDRGEPNLVGERIGKISATARQTVKSLDEIVWAVNPRNDTLAHLLDYAGQFTVDYLRTIGIRWIFPRKFLSASFPPTCATISFSSSRRRCTTFSSTPTPPRSGCASSWMAGRWKWSSRTTDAALRACLMTLWPTACATCGNA